MDRAARIPGVGLATRAAGLLRQWGASNYGTPPPSDGFDLLVTMGSATGTTDGSGDLTVTFPRAFPNGVNLVIDVAGDNLHGFSIAYTDRDLVHVQDPALHDGRCRRREHAGPVELDRDRLVT